MFSPASAGQKGRNQAAPPPVRPPPELDGDSLADEGRILKRPPGPPHDCLAGHDDRSPHARPASRRRESHVRLASGAVRLVSHTPKRLVPGPPPLDQKEKNKINKNKQTNKRRSDLGSRRKTVSPTPAHRG